jgi:hypothetical protein
MKDLGPAVIAGAIGIFSTWLAYRMGQRQLDRTRAEAQESREHQRLLLLIPKQIDAIETIWRQLFFVEQGKQPVELELDRFIRAVMWIPTGVRNEAVAVLRDSGKVNGAIPEGLRLRITELRSALIETAGINDLP